MNSYSIHRFDRASTTLKPSFIKNYPYDRTLEKDRSNGTSWSGANTEWNGHYSASRTWANRFANKKLPARTKYRRNKILNEVWPNALSSSTGVGTEMRTYGCFAEAEEIKSHWPLMRSQNVWAATNDMLRIISNGQQQLQQQNLHPTTTSLKINITA